MKEQIFNFLFNFYLYLFQMRPRNLRMDRKFPSEWSSYVETLLYCWKLKSGYELNFTDSLARHNTTRLKGGGLTIILVMWKEGSNITDY